MKPHPRIRKAIKWGGAAVTVLLAVVWIDSWTSYYSWGASSRGPVTIQRGVVDIAYLPRSPQYIEEDLLTLATGLHRLGDFAWVPLHGGAAVRFPLWIPALCIGAATVVAWRLDALVRRRARLNLCPKCGYDRAGLGAGVRCPECGTGGTPA